MPLEGKILPKHIRSQVKPRPYESREKSGRFKTWERDIRQFCRLQGLEPDLSPEQDIICRQIIEMSCTGEALLYIQRIDPHRHTFESLLQALSDRFTHPEEARNARKALDNLRMSGMSARDYCNKFERLLDEAPPMSEADILFCFHKGLPEWLQTWMNYHA